MANISWIPLIRSPKGKGKCFELTGVQVNKVNVSSMALERKCILLRISGDFELSEFELLGSNCIQIFCHFYIIFVLPWSMSYLMGLMINCIDHYTDFQCEIW